MSSSQSKAIEYVIEDPVLLRFKKPSDPSPDHYHDNLRDLVKGSRQEAGFPDVSVEFVGMEKYNDSFVNGSVSAARL
jgi:hypothetical protein